MGFTVGSRSPARSSTQQVGRSQEYIQVQICLPPRLARVWRLREIVYFANAKEKVEDAGASSIAKQSASSTTANVQPTIENVATTSIGRACKKRASNDVNDVDDNTLRSSWGTHPSCYSTRCSWSIPRYSIPCWF
jgi:hypothetical protein